METRGRVVYTLPLPAFESTITTQPALPGCMRGVNELAAWAVLSTSLFPRVSVSSWLTCEYLFGERGTRIVETAVIFIVPFRVFGMFFCFSLVFPRFLILRSQTHAYVLGSRHQPCNILLRMVPGRHYTLLPTSCQQAYQVDIAAAVRID